MKVTTSKATTLLNACSRTCLSAGVAAALSLSVMGSVWAADHADSPSQRLNEAMSNPEVRTSDINDLYAFMNPNNAEELVLVMTIAPQATAEDRFATNINYKFLIQNYDTSTSPETAGDHLLIQCNFPTAETVNCVLGDLTVSGAFNGTVGSFDTGMRVYTGLRDDPFFFNGGGLSATLANFEDDNPDNNTLEFVNGAALNANGQINGFADQNILGLVVGVNRDLLTANQARPQLRIWTATEPR